MITLNCGGTRLKLGRPHCLASIVQGRRRRGGRQDPAPRGMVLEESGDGTCWIAVQAPAVLASSLPCSQTAAMGPVLLVGHRAQVGEQIRLAVRGK